MAGPQVEDDDFAVQWSGQGGLDRAEIRRTEQQQPCPARQLLGERRSVVGMLVRGGGCRPGVGRPQPDPHDERTVLGQGRGDGRVHRLGQRGRDEDAQSAGAGQSVLPGHEVFPGHHGGHLGRDRHIISHLP